MDEPLPLEERAASSSPQPRSPYKRWFYILLVVLIVFLAIMGYFVVLVVQNINSVEGDQDATTSGTTRIATTDDPWAGTEDAAIVIVEFSDFQCPFCYQSFPVVREVISQYGDVIKVIFRDFPITDSHPQAQKAAEAGECAHDQGKFWEMHDKMFLNQQDLTTASLKRYAAEVGLGQAEFNECLDTGRTADEVLQDFEDGLLSGVTGTPTFFINGVMMQGSADFSTFSNAIEQLLTLQQ